LTFVKHQELTGKILEAAFAVANELGAGFLESVYQNALCVALLDSGLSTMPQAPLEVRFRAQIVGQYFADILVNDLVVLELKAVKALAPEHEAQILNYLKATGKPVGLLLNFGTPRLEYRRYENRF
jgi:GxxExxY protein